MSFLGSVRLLPASRHGGDPGIGRRGDDEEQEQKQDGRLGLHRSPLGVGVLREQLVRAALHLSMYWPLCRSLEGYSFSKKESSHRTDYDETRRI